MNAQRRIEHRILAQHQAIAERLASDPATVLAHAQANLARWSRKYEADDQPAWMREWNVLLAAPLSEVLVVLTSESEQAIRLRSSSPFAGVLSARERWRIIKDTGRETP